jgi:apolipoprotein N-acyltransferase
VGWILIATSVLVLVPVALQLRKRERGLRDFVGYFIFAAGLFTVGAAERWLAGDAEQIAMLSGLAAVVLGLIVARLAAR